MRRIRILVVAACACLAACENPRDVLNGVIRGQGFIPFELPMDSTRVGTILRGNANQMYLVARPERCFPDLAADQSLRYVQDVDLPKQYQHITIGFDAKLNNLFSSGNASLNFNVDAQFVHNVEMEFHGAKVEFLEEFTFYDWLQNGMSNACKTALSKYPFIGQGLRVESMRFIFKDELGAAINLNGKLDEIVDIAADVRFHIENNYELVIETPKYIGYRMAKLELSGSGPELLYASDTDRKGNWLFHAVNVFGARTPLKSIQAEPAEPLVYW